MSKDNKAEVIKRLERLADKIKKERREMAAMRLNWWLDFKHTGVIELLKKHGEQTLSKDDITHEESHESYITYVAEYIKNDFVNK